MHLTSLPGYISALSFAPTNAIPYGELRVKFPCIAKIAEGHDKEWSAAQGSFQGHTDWVRSVAFSPDGTRIVSGSDDNTVRVWDADRGVWIGSPLQGHAEGVISVPFYPDGTRIVSGSDEKTVKVWDANKEVRIN